MKTSRNHSHFRDDDDGDGDGRDDDHNDRDDHDHDDRGNNVHIVGDIRSYFHSMDMHHLRIEQIKFIESIFIQMKMKKSYIVLWVLR